MCIESIKKRLLEIVILSNTDRPNQMFIIHMLMHIINIRIITYPVVCPTYMHMHILNSPRSLLCLHTAERVACKLTCVCVCVSALLIGSMRESLICWRARRLFLFRG